jgi:DNA-directed RNA polymerase subunit E'/Rpb7|tara:strand:+ start:1054 stop:1602 length:549 start_codon:yes stop_codon:yes gene_type:complete
MEEERVIYGVYEKCMLNKNIRLHIREIGSQIKQNLENKINNNFIGKCIPEGFIKPNTISILNYSSGMIDGEHINFNVNFECKICNPVEGMLIECLVKNITKAGISAESLNNDDGYNPINVFIARDHHYNENYFNSIKNNQKVIVSVIGSRFELNDTCIVVLGKLKYDHKNDLNKSKPILNIE